MPPQPVDTRTGPLNFSELIRQVVSGHQGEKFTLTELSGQLRDRTWGGLLLIFAAINVLPLPPGATTVTGIPLIILTAQLAAGRTVPWFPRRFDRRGVSKDELRRISSKIRPWERRVERLFKPRLTALTNHRAARVIGAVSLILSIILWLPIPLGNHAPAITMTIFALALIYRDGLLVIIGAIGVIASLVLVSASIGIAWFATLALVRHLTG